MSSDLEQLVREGLDRLAATAPAPTGLVARARRHLRRRRLTAGSAVSGTAAAVAVLAAVVGAGAAAGPDGHPGAQRAIAAQMDARVVLRHMERALAAPRQVMRAESVSTMEGAGIAGQQAAKSVTWVYGNRNRFVEYNQDGSLYLADGTAMIHRRLRGVYVTYFDRRWSGGGRAYQPPGSACGRAPWMGAPSVPAANWPRFIKASLGCGAARVTGRVWIHGVDTLEITGVPFPFGHGPHPHIIRFALYVDPSTYLPVRMFGSTSSWGRGISGGRPGYYVYKSVTDITWLRPTRANAARALITIPPGFKHVTSPADQ